VRPTITARSVVLTHEVSKATGGKGIAEDASSENSQAMGGPPRNWLTICPNSLWGFRTRLKALMRAGSGSTWHEIGRAWDSSEGPCPFDASRSRRCRRPRRTRLGTFVGLQDRSLGLHPNARRQRLR
jgi:hypothetical protein